MCGVSVDLVSRMYVLFVGVGVMPDSKRQCSKCQFFQSAQLSGNGWCTHPKRQLASDVKILVRERELACRNSWGDDLWADANAEKAGGAPSDAVVPPRKGLFFANQQGDDEVTSVVDTAARRDPDASANRSGDRHPDDIVTFTSVGRDDAPADRPAPRPASGDLNGPAIADQAERARLIARGSKDAIQKARERHTRRRKPERNMVAPDAADPASDRIIAAQDREHYAPTPAAERTPEETYRATPPVPREEVEAKGNDLSPASGTDARFDSVAEVKPEVDLSQLRGFLSHSGPSRRNAAGPEAAVTTSYDLVLKRAQEIKAAGDIERGIHRSASASVTNHEPARNPAPRTKPHQAPGLPHADPRSTNGVVWDVEGERLSVAFERARVAIDAPIMPKAPRIDSPAPVDRHVVDGPGEDLFAGFDHDPEDSTYPLVDVAHADETEPYDVLAEDGHLDGSSYRDDEAWLDLDADDFLDAPVARRESPRGSWWRSLNFGLKRRYRSEPVERAWYADDEAREPFRGIVAEAEDDRFEDVDRHEPDDGFTVRYDEADDADLVFATSDESWVQDAWEFPEPQPAEWHEVRAELLGYPAGPVRDEWVPTGDFIDSSLDSDQARHGDDAVAYREELVLHAGSGRGESPTFAFDEPAGMDAFRAALFGAGLSPSPDVQAISPGSPALPAEGFDGPQRFVPVTAVETRSSSRDAQPGRMRGEPARGSAGYGSSRAPRGSRFSSAHDAFDPEFDIRDAIDDQDAVVELHFDVASRVPKACSTCRSFRPSETGDRGWCMNDWSSTHRQMVNADDLACRSSIGDWWLASDTSWIPPSDTIQPRTPRTDRLVARSEGREATPQTGRRVRTSKVG